ncbi:hypothetical protein DPMN_142438 [Dreissena polymorpha]|uniref:Uncharacterized protein n=1 Tax=Dreissena polymorpha TaxID=45954 RepID=A0A9D4JKS7_DREPO|nr:hypothetical protein DPMN_142438 [Dreissena polymorpha]
MIMPISLLENWNAQMKALTKYTQFTIVTLPHGQTKMYQTQLCRWYNSGAKSARMPTTKQSLCLYIAVLVLVGPVRLLRLIICTIKGSQYMR